MKKYTLFLSLLFCFSTFSQTVSNFTGTDIHGDSHYLFEYLDAGKYVVIKFTQTQ